jgi:hypothetical protein
MSNPGVGAGRPGTQVPLTFPNPVIKRDRVIAAPPDPPAKNLFVEFSRALDVTRGHLDVTDFAVS